MRIVGDRWRDEEGRRLMLRGANLGGDCKVPAGPLGASHVKESLRDRSKASFVGRPFPLEEADEHLERLSRWGLDFLRLLVTWEAVEHEGPGVYDLEYLDYIEAVAAKAQAKGMRMFVDPHQDVWSRWTGGDGAPCWTLEAAGFDPSSLHASGAAILHQELGSAYPQMIWSTGYNRLASATMFTLFFGGSAFAPGLVAEGRPIQELLQGCYIGAMREIAKRLGRFPNVIGFDSLNEPSGGFIGLSDLSLLQSALNKTGPMPTPYQAMLAGSGRRVEVERYGIRLPVGQGVVGKAFIGTEGVRAWREGSDCPWKRLGVWAEEAEGPRLLRPAHFAEAGGRRIEFAKDFLMPFVRRYIGEIRSASEGGRRLAVFVEGIPEGGRPAWDPARDPGPAVNGTHWYDGFTLYLKRWTGCIAFDAETGAVFLGRRAVRRYFRDALARIKEHSEKAMGGIPTCIGEFGLPFDLSRGRSYKGRRKGDYRPQERALSAYYDALDASLLDSTIWNYSAANSHEQGDLWNGEDLSIFCAEEAQEGRTETGEAADRGGRALRGFVRPRGRAVAGDILETSFSARSGDFLLRYRPDPAVAAPTEVFVPAIQYPRGFSVRVEGGESETLGSKSLLLVRARPGSSEVVVRITRS
jgi:hypothetical protein